MNNRVFTGKVRHVYAAGDLHGDYESFKKILRAYQNMTGDSLLLFLGDYADRGFAGVEIIMELNRLLDERADIIALKGNHEIYTDGRPAFSPCNLIDEAEAKYGSWARFSREIMRGFLSRLYIAALINNVLFVHAGISSRIKTAEDLAGHENEADLLWSDPSPLRGEHPNMRGAGVTFGKDVTAGVLQSLGVKLLVRSHEPAKAASGPCLEHGGRVITTNACSTYGESWRPFLLGLDTETLKYETVFL